MLTRDQAAALAGRTLTDRDGEPLGTVTELYPGAGDDMPAWAGVELGGQQRAVPLDGAEPDGGGARVRFRREEVAAAPPVEADALAGDLLERLHAHYGVSDAELRDDSGFSTAAADDHP
jgi:hypothetical protein